LHLATSNLQLAAYKSTTELHIIMPTEFGPEYVRRLAPYQAGKPISEVAREFGLDEAGIVKLASNENPLGMPESARTGHAGGGG
jgi:hypothetical protein